MVSNTFWKEAQLQHKRKTAWNKVECEERQEIRQGSAEPGDKEPGLHPEGDGELLKGVRQERNLASFML